MTLSQEGNTVEVKAGGEAELLPTVYIASKTKHAAMWRQLRDEGVPIISTWIDEAGAGESGDLNDLWHRCIAESSAADVLVIYREPDDVLKGGWVELGAALASGKPVMAVGLTGFTIAKHSGIQHFANYIDAFYAASKIEPRRSPVTGEVRVTEEMVKRGVVKLYQYGLDDGGSPALMKSAMHAAITSALSSLEHSEKEGGVIVEIAAERQRQIGAEGWTPEHDDAHTKGELATAAACYAANLTGGTAANQFIKLRWPWDRLWWKPTNRRRDLIKAAALIVAEIQRLDRAAALEPTRPSPPKQHSIEEKG